MADRVNYKAKVDDTAVYKYIGEARPGVADSAARWRILRIDKATNDCTWAASGEFQAVWADRATLSYT